MQINVRRNGAIDLEHDVSLFKSVYNMLNNFWPQPLQEYETDY